MRFEAFMKITEAQLHRYVERGREYFNQGLVVLDEIAADTVRASCVGNQVYKTELYFKNARLEGGCT